MQTIESEVKELEDKLQELISKHEELEK